ncbi:hypothetical protein AGMMS49940_24520 [Spirochaetia bacterium]|nr:hypothetical protein AGMMS49940_24520 [Spirochaetia bacterium]
MTDDEFLSKVQSVGGKPGPLTTGNYKLINAMMVPSETIVAAAEFGGLTGTGAAVVTDKNFYWCAGTIKKDKLSSQLSRISSVNVQGLISKKLTFRDGVQQYILEGISNADSISNAIRSGQ